MRLLKVLVVDDEAANREIAEVILRGAGHEVTTASDGAEGLALCLAHRFDLVVMDILMPAMDGIEAIRALRANPFTKDLPVLCLSAKASGSDREAGLAAGCDHYLTKPFKRLELLAAVDQTLEERGRASG